MSLDCIQLEPRPNIQGYYDCAIWQEVDQGAQTNSSVSFITPELVGILILYALILNIFSSFVRLVSRDMFDK